MTTNLPKTGLLYKDFRINFFVEKKALECFQGSFDEVADSNDFDKFQSTSASGSKNSSSLKEFEVKHVIDDFQCSRKTK